MKKTKKRSKKRASHRPAQNMPDKRRKYRGAIIAVVCAVVLMAAVVIGVTLIRNLSPESEPLVEEEPPVTGYSVMVQYAVTSANDEEIATLAQTCSALLKDRACVERLVEESGLSLSYEEASAMLEVSHVSKTDLLDVEITGKNKDEVKALGRALQAVFPEAVSEVDSAITLKIAESSFVEHVGD